MLGEVLSSYFIVPLKCEAHAPTIRGLGDRRKILQQFHYDAQKAACRAIGRSSFRCARGVRLPETRSIDAIPNSQRSPERLKPARSKFHSFQTPLSAIPATFGQHRGLAQFPQRTQLTPQHPGKHAAATPDSTPPNPTLSHSPTHSHYRALPNARFASVLHPTSPTLAHPSQTWPARCEYLRGRSRAPAANHSRPFDR